MRTPEQTRVRMVKWAENVSWYKNPEQLRLSQVQRDRIFYEIFTEYGAELYLQKKDKRRWWQFLWNTNPY